MIVGRGIPPTSTFYYHSTKNQQPNHKTKTNAEPKKNTVEKQQKTAEKPNNQHSKTTRCRPIVQPHDCEDAISIVCRFQRKTAYKNATKSVTIEVRLNNRFRPSIVPHRTMMRAHTQLALSTFKDTSRPDKQRTFKACSPSE